MQTFNIWDFLYSAMNFLKEVSNWAIEYFWIIGPALIITIIGLILVKLFT